MTLALPSPAAARRRGRLAVAVLACGCAAAFAAARAADDAIAPGDRKQLADGLFSRGLYALALPEYQALAGIRPPVPPLDEILFRLGECQRRLEQPAEAESSYRRLAAECPASPLRDRAVLMRGLIVLEMGRPAIAAELLESLLSTNAAPDVAGAARYHAGQAREQAGDLARAQEHYQALRVQAPAHELAVYAGLRLAALRAREQTPAATAAALAIYQQIAGQPPDARAGAEALFQAATLADQSGDGETAARLYRRLAERYPLDSRTAEAARPAAWAHLRTGRTADALAYATRALAEASTLTPAERAEWHYLQANSQRLLEQRDEAVASYDALLLVDPRSSFAPAARFERLVALFKSGAYERVLKDADAFTDPPPNQRPDLLWMQANAAEALKDAARAVQFYRMLAEQAPQSPLAADATYRLAYQLQQQQAWAEASRRYLELADRWPTNALAPRALFASGLCLAQAGQPDGALRDWRRLLTTFPTHETVPDALFQKGLEEIRLGQDREAGTTLDGLLREHDGYARLDEARFWRAHLAYAAREFALAEQFLRAALAGHPPVAVRREAEFLLGLVLQATGRDAEAAACFQPLLHAPIIEKFTIDRLSWLAEFQYARQALAESEAAARAMQAHAPSDDWRQAAAALLGRALQGAGKRDEAITAYQQALATPARTRYGAEAALRLGELLLETGRAAEAEGRLRDAAERAAVPELQDIRALAYAALGQAAERRGDRETAIRYHMSVALLFDDADRVPAALDRAATLLAELGRGEESRAAADELLTRYPDAPQAARWRADAAAPATPPAGEGP